MYQRTLSNYKVELADKELASPDKPAKVHIYARSVNEVSRLCGREYEDFDGMNAPDVISLNVEHDVDRTIGKAFNLQRTKYGLECDAEIYPALPVQNADGQRVINMLKLGIPLQASITFDIDNLDDVEEVDEGQKAEVNGLTIEGPAVIYRRWNLRSLAICIHGADNATGVEAISLNSENIKEFFAMKKNRSEDAESDEKEKNVEEKQREDGEVETPETESQPDDRLSAIEAAIDELKTEVSEIKAKLASETDAVQIEESDKEPEKDDDKEKELSKKIDALEKTLQTYNDNFVKMLSAEKAESKPVGYVGTDETPGSGSIRFSARGVPTNVK